MKAYALIPAAGSGSRMSANLPKQYVEIGGRPLLFYAVRALATHPRIEQVFVVLAQGDDRFARCDWRDFGARIEPLYCGGETRAASVFNGLLAARDTVAGADWVLVHDAARPCLGREAVDRLFAEIGEDDAGGLLAVPVADTLKRANRDLRVAHTEPRDNLWLAQTPQMFRYRLLIEALRAADPAIATDEARAIEGLGLKPKLVLGDTSNIKVTFPEDLALAELILGSRQLRAASRQPSATSREPRAASSQQERKPSRRRGKAIR
ncbi:MAG: 2-C-methyl-D-erythritol 4-phosphate cytidylyltransferase [Betaproteobacteria bacterium]|nr:2-C-methyl-D-erythritol 4-phosphate cytidylyltransferase [Betaproteobacteria bacterium]